MKKRAFFLSAKIIAIMILVCACSGGQETEEVQEKEASVPEEQAAVIMEPVAAEQSEAETEFAVGAEEFQTWDLGLYGRLNSETDTLGCWGLENLEMGYGFFEFVLTSNDKCVTF